MLHQSPCKKTTPPIKNVSLSGFSRMPFGAFGLRADTTVYKRYHFRYHAYLPTTYVAKVQPSVLSDFTVNRTSVFQSRIKHERVHFHPRWTGWMPNWQRLLGAVLSRAWDNAGRNDAVGQNHRIRRRFV